VSKPGPVIALVVAIGENGAIGRGGDLPWKLSTDLRYFRNVTLRKPIIMGRRTFESFPRALDQRLNIVLSRDPAYLAPGAIVVPILDAALDTARSAAQQAGVEEIMIVGGDDVFREVLPKASRIYLTEVHASPDADVWFTSIASNGGKSPANVMSPARRTTTPSVSWCWSGFEGSAPTLHGPGACPITLSTFDAELPFSCG
jgi:dihydrofolate reductase